VNNFLIIFLLIFLETTLSLAQAEQTEEVYKCVIDYKTIYQTEPCPTKAAKQAEIKIEKEDPAKAAEAQARLRAWEENFSAREAAEKAAEREAQKERQAELDRQATINALNRNAQAQQELAESARQRTFNSYGNYGYPYSFYPGGIYQGGFGNPHHHDHWQQQQNPVPRPPQRHGTGLIAR
jgi:Skp family chaperone for outer membrane proteins